MNPHGIIYLVHQAKKRKRGIEKRLLMMQICESEVRVCVYIIYAIKEKKKKKVIVIKKED